MKTIFALVLIVLAAPILAQEEPIFKNPASGFCYNTAIESIQNSKLNTFLTDYNYFENSKTINLTSMGYSIRTIGGQSIIKAIFLIGRSTPNDSKNITLLILYGVGLDYFYDFSKTDNWLIAPALGIRMNSYHLNPVSQNSISMLSGQSLVENFQVKNKFLCNLGLEVDKQIKIFFVNAYLGLKPYYNIDFKESSWRTSSLQQLDNIPSIDFSGFGISFNIRIEFNWDKLEELSTK
jgi:hypothetical protein